MSQNDDAQPYQKGCPHFGIVGDPDTRPLYPSSQGCCYRAQPPGIVTLAHQQSHCLTEQHVKCPVLQKDTRQPLPPELKGQAEGASVNGGRKIPTAVLVVAIVALLLLVGWVGTRWFLNATAEEVEPAANTGAVAVITTGTATATPEPTATEVLMEETAVITTTATPAASPIPLNSPTPSPSATPIVYPFAAVSESGLALRAGPGLAYPFLGGVLEAGTLVEIVGRSGNGRWWQICCLREAIGWVTSDNLTVSGAADATPVPTVDTNVLPQAIVQTARLNVRQGPSTDFEIVGQVELDGRYEIIGRNNDDSWWQICCLDGESGWVIAEGIAITGQVANVPVIGDR